MAIRIRAPRNKATAAYVRSLFLNAENEIVHEIMRKRASGYVDYADVATLGRIRATLQSMVDESWQYVPKMVEKYFYTGEGPAKGYASAWKMQRATPGRIHLIELLSDNLLGEIGEMATTAYIASQTALADLATLAGGSVPVVGPMTPGPLRSAILNMTAATQAIGESPVKLTDRYLIALQQSGITGFVDKGGRAWSLRNYGDMAVRTTSRQAAVAELLTRDDEQDLYMISSIGSTCPICAPLEGRVYSKSGTNPNYPPLSLAFGKIDPTGPEDLSNTYLNIHPSCLHSLTPYTELGKTPKQVERIRNFSNPETNPLDRDPRSKKQIEAYREKERNRAAYLREFKKKQKARLERQMAKAAKESEATN